MTVTSRRGLMSVGAAGLFVAGCDRITGSPAVERFVGRGGALTFRAQRLLLADQPLAREFKASDISRVFKPNGTMRPTTAAYDAILADNFASWRLAVEGLVGAPASFSLAELKAMPARTQITRHDCVEGWSAIGGWTGVPLSLLLGQVGLKPQTRFIVFHCADNLGGSLDNTGLYYESIDLFDAFHPQTILAYGLNGRDLPVANGAPLRLRVERQLGYKQAKYVMRIEATDRLDNLVGGQGGFWEDRGYAWYAGI